MANHFTDYEYTPLNMESSEIQLLTLHPGNMSSGIEIELTTTSLDDEYPIYEALSYTWGNPTMRHSIQINGCALEIASSLYHALNHLRYQDASRFLWIDAICINQRDLEEKSHQVRRMTTIYRRAKQVVCWLGEKVGLIGNVFAVLEDLAVIKERRFKSISAEAQTNEGNEWIKPQRDPAIRDAVRDLVERLYWKRAWIVQEVLSAEYVLLMCGDYTIPWTVVMRGWGPISLAPQIRLYKMFGDVTWLSLLLQWDSDQEKRSSILDHLHQFRWWQVTNPLDMIYAIIWSPLPRRYDDSQNGLSLFGSSALADLREMTYIRDPNT